ncbi:hypothetical protein DMC30DRAFT_193891 [Rhodotorula diobovata]|uniref:Uncharacterized protein n=1 Tax=Rhodotorula diobovata TaxID=5288 RepID=A0A5C5G5D0_9BASI|nr:hypothetical protein DMC30DRAFT_193891 [Rhodotorula diobovata]
MEGSVGGTGGAVRCEWKGHVRTACSGLEDEDEWRRGRIESKSRSSLSPCRASRVVSRGERVGETALHEREGRGAQEPARGSRYQTRVMYAAPQTVLHESLELWTSQSRAGCRREAEAEWEMAAQTRDSSGSSKQGLRRMHREHRLSKQRVARTRRGQEWMGHKWSIPPGRLVPSLLHPLFTHSLTMSGSWRGVLRCVSSVPS